MNSIIPLQQIEQQIKDELQQHYNIVNYTCYGSNDNEKVQSFRLRYHKILQQGVKETFMNEKLQFKEVVGDLVETFIVRGIDGEHQFDVYGIFSSGETFRKN